MTDVVALQARLARVVASEEALRAAREQQGTNSGSPAPSASGLPAPTQEQRLLKSLDMEFEEEWTRLRHSSGSALGDQLAGAKLDEGDSSGSPVDVSPTGARSTWRSSIKTASPAAAQESAVRQGAEGVPTPTTPGSPTAVLQLELPAIDRVSYGHAFSVAPLALPDADAVASAAGVMVPTDTPVLARLSFAERRAYAADAAAFAHRLADDTRLLGEGWLGVRFAVSGLARFGQVRGARLRALTWLSARLKPGAPLSGDALDAALNSDALPLAVRALAIANAEAGRDDAVADAACGLCAALVERTPGGAPAHVIAAAGGISACVDALRRPKGPHSAAARLLCALVCRPSASQDAGAESSLSMSDADANEASSVAADERAASAVSLGAVPVLAAVIAAATPGSTAAASPTASAPGILNASASPAAASDVVLPHCLGVLCALARAPGSATAALDPVGGIETFGAALHACWDTASGSTIIPAPAVQRLGIACAAACCAIASHSTDWAARLASCGGTSCVACLMTCCESSARVQRDGCAALRHMATASSTAATTMGECKAISAAVAALRAHPDDPDVAQAAAKALACAAASAAPSCVPNNTAAVKCGGIEALVAALARHKDHPSVLDAGYRAIYAYVFHSGGVVHALERVSATPGGRECLLVAVGAVAVGPGARDQCLSAMGVLNQAASALRAQSGDEK